VNLNLHLTTDTTDLRAEGYVLDGRLFAEVRSGFPDPTSRLGDGVLWGTPGDATAGRVGRPGRHPGRGGSRLARPWFSRGRRAGEPRGMTTTSARQPLHQPDQPQHPKGRPAGHHQPHPPLQLGPPGRRTPSAQHSPDLHRGHQHLGDAHRHQQPIHRGGEYATATLGETVA
jgi:hypothetical protein